MIPFTRTLYWDLLFHPLSARAWWQYPDNLFSDAGEVSVEFCLLIFLALRSPA